MGSSAVAGAPRLPATPGRLGNRRLLAINAFWLGNGAHWQPLFVALVPVGARLVAPGDSEELIGRATAAGGVFALLVPVIVGWLSDRTTSRWGRRRPWMVGGTLANLAGLGLLAAAPSPLTLVLAYLIVQGGNNIAGAAYSGVIPDLVPVAERGRASGLLGTMNGVGTVIGVGAVAFLLAELGSTRAGIVAGYLAVAVILVVTLAITCASIHERVLPPVAKGVRRPGPGTNALLFGIPFALAVTGLLVILAAPELRSMPLTLATLVLVLAAAVAGSRLPALRAFLAPLRGGDFFWVLATRTLVQLGIFSITPFMEPYFHDVVGGGNSGATSARWLLFVIAFGIPPALVGGAISDRIRRRKMFVYASGVLQGGVVGVLLFGLVSSLPMLYFLGALFGVGYGLYYAIDWALACDVLPDVAGAAGKDMALWHVSLTLPQVVAPAILGGVLHSLNQSGHSVLGVATGGHLGFRLVFGTAALWFILGTVMVSRIRGVQ